MLWFYCDELLKSIRRITCGEHAAAIANGQHTCCDAATLQHKFGDPHHTETPQASHGRLVKPLGTVVGGEASLPQQQQGSNSS
mmetsp:Transcript_143895/g.365283  ORF Transcript_143895/g.365283 Transcript_143895/m.365283 type:complete len:83 (+) Transcript_143895:105-353(+)